MKIQPLNDRVLVVRIEEEQKTSAASSFLTQRKKNPRKEK